MPRFVSLSRAAKLVGISRGAMQKKVHDLELDSFEGQVNLSDIERVFPDAQLEDNHIIEDLEKIVEQSLHRARGSKLAKLLSPDSHTLAARLQNITKEHSHAKTQVNQLLTLFQQVKSKISALAETSEQPHLFQDINNWIDDSLDNIQISSNKLSPLLEKDTLLRVIAAQVHIKNTGHEFFVEGNNSILEAGLSAGLALNYGCSNGNCGKCKARLLSGEIKKTKPHDFVFSEKEKLQNYFLCCSNTAVTEIEIEAEEAGNENDIPQQNISAKVKKIDKISEQILILNLKTPRTKRLRFIAGQSAILSRADLPPLEIPIASCPCDDMNIQFHISKNEADPFSQYIYNNINNSDSIQITGPTGSFVLDDDSDNPVIFIAFDTGFAPIKSLIEHVVTLDHAEFIHLFWLHTAEKPYMHNQCRAWQDALDNFNYHHQQYDITNNRHLEDKLKQLADDYSYLNTSNIFICGPEKMVEMTRKILINHDADEKRLKIQIL
jgi:CDP-4-dehydro-6-deoxyglucose reductase